jgi:hypothetical protein
MMVSSKAFSFRGQLRPIKAFYSIPAQTGEAIMGIQNIALPVAVDSTRIHSAAIVNHGSPLRLGTLALLRKSLRCFTKSDSSL